jgi:pyrroloquinoline-quinone synthase
VYHALVWRGLLEERIAAHPEAADAALNAAENAARMLWQALDGIDARRISMAVA